MQINRINNTQSFGMACKVGGDLVKTVEQLTANPKNAKKLEKLRTIFLTFNEMPGDFYVGLSKKNPKKFLVGLLKENSEIISGRTYRVLRPKKIIKRASQDVVDIASDRAKQKIAKDVVESVSKYFS